MSPLHMRITTATPHSHLCTQLLLTPDWPVMAVQPVAEKVQRYCHPAVCRICVCVAVLMVAMQLDTDTMLLPEHQNEIEILMKMEHEHVIGYHGSFINRVGRWPSLYIITDYADGIDGSSHVRQCSLCRQHAKCAVAQVAHWKM